LKPLVARVPNVGSVTVETGADLQLDADSSNGGCFCSCSCSCSCERSFSRACPPALSFSHPTFVLHPTSPLQTDLRRGLDKKEEWKKTSDTVEVMSVPTNLCTESSLRGYYSKFGKVVRILIDEQVVWEAGVLLQGFGRQGYCFRGGGGRGIASGGQSWGYLQQAHT
jgi:hypothetical protein